MENLIRILHISDLHIPFTNEDRKRSEKILERFFSILEIYCHKSIYSSGKPMNHIVLSGDLFDSTQVFNSSSNNEKIKKATDEIVEFIEKLMKVVGIKNKSFVHIVPGNHDLHRGDDADIDRVAKIASLQKPFESEENLTYLSNRFRYFWYLCDVFYGKNNPYNSHNNSIHTQRTIDNITFCYLNTELLCISSRKDDTLGETTIASKVINETNLNFGIDQICDIIKSLPKTTKMVVFLAHHPPKNNGQMSGLYDIVKKDTNRKYFWLCGHMHSDRIVPCDCMRVYQAGSISGNSGSIPDFVIHELSEELKSKRIAYRFLSHLNNGDADGSGGWKNVFLFDSSLSVEVKSYRLPDYNILEVDGDI